MGAMSRRMSLSCNRINPSPQILRGPSSAKKKIKFASTDNGDTVFQNLQKQKTEPISICEFALQTRDDDEGESEHDDVPTSGQIISKPTKSFSFSDLESPSKPKRKYASFSISARSSPVLIKSSSTKQKASAIENKGLSAEPPTFSFSDLVSPSSSPLLKKIKSPSPTENDRLPVVGKEDNGHCCSYISCDTMLGLLDGTFDHDLFDYMVIVDCRYDYEYAGGHINGAINVSDKLLLDCLFNANVNLPNVDSQRICWIFHCEYSKHRGPMSSVYFRKLDRERNANAYPYVSYPHVYVLQGGYKAFWHAYKDKYHALANGLYARYGYISMWNDTFDILRFAYGQFRRIVWKKPKQKCKRKKMMIKKSKTDNDAQQQQHPTSS